ncbi:hypothetical protein ACO0QE_000532 [Hanseniaspora vineae]
MEHNNPDFSNKTGNNTTDFGSSTNYLAEENSTKSNETQREKATSKKVSKKAAYGSKKSERPQSIKKEEDKKLHSDSGFKSSTHSRPSSSVIGISRVIASCQRCRLKKVRCDNQFPSCTRCAKMNLSCVSIDPATGREIPRSYVIYLEDKLYACMLKLNELGVDLSATSLKTNIPCTSQDPPCNIDLYQERFRDQHTLPPENVMAGYVINKGTSMQKGVPSELALNELSESSMTSEKVYSMKMQDSQTSKEVDGDLSMEKEHIDALKNPLPQQNDSTPLSSSSVNLQHSPSGNAPEINFTLQEQKFPAATQHRSPTSSLSGSHLSPQKLGSETNMHSKASRLEARPASHASTPSNSYLGDSSGIPFAKLMFTAVNFEPSSDNFFNESEKESEQNQTSDFSDADIKPPSVSDDINHRFLPPKKEALNLIQTYFVDSNTQYPVLHRDFFIKKYFEPIYGEFPKRHNNSTANVPKSRNTHDTSGASTPLNVTNTGANTASSPSTLQPKNEGQSTKDETASIYSSSSTGEKASRKTFVHSLANDFTNMNDNFKLLPEHSLEKDEQYLELINKLSSTGTYNIDGKNDNDDTVIPLYDIISSIPEDEEIPLVYQIPLFFINMVMAIGAGSRVLISGTVKSIIFKKRATKYMNSIYASSNRLEALSGLLLLSIYSLMLPNVPGVWYVMGNSLRLCVDLGLHAEKLNKNYDPFVKDMRRRLFWVTYSIDRQICLYFGRPFGIPEESITTASISELDDALITTNNDGVEDYSHLKTSGSSYKSISLAFFKIRRMQSTLLQVLYAPRGVVPKPFDNVEIWRKGFDRELLNWYNKSVPKTTKKMNCSFKKELFKLNLFHTRTMLYGISPRFSIPNDQACSILTETTKGMMDQYYKIFLSKGFNYTWVAVHNLFMCGMTFLYTKYRNTDLVEFDEFKEHMLAVLKSLFGTCEAAPNCFRIFRILSKAVKKLILQEISKKSSNLKAAPLMRRQSVPLSTPTVGDMANSHTDVFPRPSPLVAAPPPATAIKSDGSAGIESITSSGNQDFNSIATDDEMRKFFQELENASPYSNADSAGLPDRSPTMSSKSGVTLDDDSAFRPAGFQNIPLQNQPFQTYPQQLPFVQHRIQQPMIDERFSNRTSYAPINHGYTSWQQQQQMQMQMQMQRPQPLPQPQQQNQQENVTFNEASSHPLRHTQSYPLPEPVPSANFSNPFPPSLVHAPHHHNELSSSLQKQVLTQNMNTQNKISKDEQRIYEMMCNMGTDSVWDKYLGASDEYFDSFNNH